MDTRFMLADLLNLTSAFMRSIYRIDSLFFSLSGGQPSSFCFFFGGGGLLHFAGIKMPQIKFREREKKKRFQDRRQILNKFILEKNVRVFLWVMIMDFITVSKINTGQHCHQHSNLFVPSSGSGELPTSEMSTH